MIYASFFFVVFLHMRLFVKRGLLDPVTIFFLAYLYYLYLAPISMIAFDIYGVDVAGQTSYVPLSTINRAAVLLALGYAGYAFGYYFASKGTGFSSYQLNNHTLGFLVKDNYARVMLIFISVIILVLTTYFRQELIQSTESYEGKIAGNYASSSYAFIANSAMAILSLIVNYLILNIRRYILMTVGGVFLFILLSIGTYSKAPLIFSALCALCCVHRFRLIPYPVIIAGLIVGAVVMTMFFMPAFSIYRASGTFELRVPNIDSFALILSEAVGPFTIVHLALDGYVAVDGYPLWQSFVLWIPRALWVDRPLDLAEGFARMVIANWQIGFGLGFSPVAEAYARVGMIGSSLFMAMMGAVTALLQSTFARAVPPAMRVPAILTAGGYVSVLALRNPFSALITQTLQNWAPIVIVSLLAWEISNRMGDRSGAVTGPGPSEAAKSPTST